MVLAVYTEPDITKFSLFLWFLINLNTAFTDV